MEVQDVDGESIDSWNAWDSYILPFQTVEDIPYAHRVSWSRFISTVLHKCLYNKTEVERDPYLKWFLAPPFLLLRETKRGGKGRRGTIAGKFNLLSKGDLITLLTLLKRDLDEHKQKQAVRGDRKKDKTLDQNKRGP